MAEYIRTLEKLDISRETTTDKQRTTMDTAMQNAAIKSLRMVSKTTSHITMAIMLITTTMAHNITIQRDNQLRQAGEQTNIDGVHIRLTTDKTGNLLMGATSTTTKLHTTHLAHEFRFTEAGEAEQQLSNLIEDTSKAHDTHTGTDFPEINRPINPARTLKEACDCHLTDTTPTEITKYKNHRAAQPQNTDRWVYNHTETAPNTCKGTKEQELYEVTTGMQNNTCTINPTPRNRDTLIKKIRQHVNHLRRAMHRQGPLQPKPTSTEQDTQSQNGNPGRMHGNMPLHTEVHNMDVQHRHSQLLEAITK